MDKRNTRGMGAESHCSLLDCQCAHNLLGRPITSISMFLLRRVHPAPNVLHVSRSTPRTLVAMPPAAAAASPLFAPSGTLAEKMHVATVAVRRAAQLCTTVQTKLTEVEDLYVFICSILCCILFRAYTRFCINPI